MRAGRKTKTNSVNGCRLRIGASRAMILDFFGKLLAHIQSTIDVIGEQARALAENITVISFTVLLKATHACMQIVDAHTQICFISTFPHPYGAVKYCFSISHILGAGKFILQSNTEYPNTDFRFLFFRRHTNFLQHAYSHKLETMGPQEQTRVLAHSCNINICSWMAHIDMLENVRANRYFTGCCHSPNESSDA